MAIGEREKEKSLFREEQEQWWWCGVVSHIFLFIDVNVGN